MNVLFCCGGGSDFGLKVIVFVFQLKLNCCSVGQLIERVVRRGEERREEKREVMLIKFRIL